MSLALLNRLLKNNYRVAHLVAARDLLLPNLSFDRASHHDISDTVSQEGMSRTKRDNRIRYFVINNRPDEALDLLERSLFRTPIMDPAAQKVRYLKLPPASVCNKVLDSAAQSEDSELVLRAADLAGGLQLQGIPLEPRTAQSLIHGLANAGMIDRGIQVLDGWLAANTEILEDDDAVQEGPHQVMTCLLEDAARADDPDSITQVLLRMARIGMTPSVQTMTALLQCFTRLGNLNTAHSMLQWMRRSGLEPNAHSYAAVMTVPASLSPATAGEFLKRAKEAYEDMKEHNVQPTVQFYAAYINVVGRLRDVDAAREAWLDMEAAGLEPDLICYNTMIDACAKGGDVEGAFHLYEEMQKNHIKPDQVAFATLIQAVHGKLDQARRIWGDMIKAGITPNSNTASVYLDVLLRAGDSYGALTLLKNSTDVSLYEQAMSTAALRLQVRLLRSLVTQMKEQHVQPNAHMVTSLLIARARKAQGNSHWRLHIDSASKENAQLGNNEVLDALIETIDMNHESALESLDQKTISDGNQAAVLIGWCSAEGEVAKGLEIYEQVCNSLDRNVRAWCLKLLMAGAMAMPPEHDAQAVELVLKIVGEARRWSQAGGGWWWDQRTQKQITRLLLKSPEAAELLKNADDDNMEAQVRRLMRRK